MNDFKSGLERTSLSSILVIDDDPFLLNNGAVPLFYTFSASCGANINSMV